MYCSYYYDDGIAAFYADYRQQNHFDISIQRSKRYMVGGRIHARRKNGRHGNDYFGHQSKKEGYITTILWLMSDHPRLTGIRTEKQ